MNAACKIRVIAAVAITLLLLSGCPARVREPATSQVPVPQAQVAHEGRPYAIVPEESLLTIQVYRGGTLARMGHNHLIASHDLAGTIYVPDDLTRAGFELRIPVARLTVDEGELRAQAGADFPPEVPDSAKEDTRRNMLGPALFDAERYPEIILRSERVDVVAPNDLQAHVQVIVRDQTRSVTVPVRFEMSASELTAAGEFPLKQTDLGLTPFSAMLGALQVLDDMKIRFDIRARAAQ